MICPPKLISQKTVSPFIFYSKATFISYFILQKPLLSKFKEKLDNRSTITEADISSFKGVVVLLTKNQVLLIPFAFRHAIF